MKFSLATASGFSGSTEFSCMAGNHDRKRNSNLPPNEASSNPHCFCYCRRAVDNTIIAYIVCCGNFFLSTLSGKYSRNVASSQRNHLVCAVRLCRFVAIDRSRLVAVIGFVSNQNDDKLRPSIASSLKSTIDRGLG